LAVERHHLINNFSINQIMLCFADDWCGFTDIWWMIQVQKIGGLAWTEQVRCSGQCRSQVSARIGAALSDQN
jgi:hypothetical protein